MFGFRHSIFQALTEQWDGDSRWAFRKRREKIRKGIGLEIKVGNHPHSWNDSRKYSDLMSGSNIV